MTGKQKWITDIKYINTADEAITPTLIFKGEYINTRWINEEISNGWYFVISKNNWTLNDLNLY